MNERLETLVNHSLDKLVRPRFRVWPASWPAFQVCGYTGLALAILLAMSLVTYRGLSPWVMAGIILTAVLTILGLAMATKIITGAEKLVYYHHEIAVMVMTALLLWLWGQPLLPYLDVTILSAGMFLTCGRVGCLMAGCCHGRPHRWGVCYRAEHAAAGFTPYFVGVRLLPIQGIESLWVLCLVLVGSALVLSGQLPGTALAWYVVTYDLGRFWFEFVRGDAVRPYIWGFSEAQWTSLFLMGAVVGAELAGLLPFQGWHGGATALLVLAMIITTLSRRFQRTAKYQLLHPYHIKEVAEAVEQLSNLATTRNTISEQSSIQQDIQVGCTSLGIQISASRVKSVTGYMDHYALSAQNGGMTEEMARILAGLILQIRPPAGPMEIIKGNQGVYHLLVQMR